MSSLTDRLNEAHIWLTDQIELPPEIGLVLGSGLGSFVDQINLEKTFPYQKIPHFPEVTVEGHKGQLVFGYWRATPLIIACGRHHLYEGYSLDEITFPVRLFHRLGAQSVIITNSAGCANPDYMPGEFMTITNHFPMVPWMLPAAYQSPQPARIWDVQTTELLRNAASEKGYVLRNGTYAWTTGPSYETPAEVQYLRNLCADAIGMSTVPEAIAAAQAGMNVLGISCFTNYAAGLSEEPLTHEEVQAMAARMKAPFAEILKLAIELL